MRQFFQGMQSLCGDRRECDVYERKATSPDRISWCAAAVLRRSLRLRIRSALTAIPLSRTRAMSRACPGPRQAARVRRVKVTRSSR